MRNFSVALALFCSVLLVVGCGQTNQEASGTDTNSHSVLSSEEISLTRDKVQSTPVASYNEKVDDDLNDWYFSADLYETKQRFDYIVEMRYQEIAASDSIHFPNFGMDPQPKIQKGANKQECIIGFLDRNGEFREYVKVFVQDGALRMKTIKHYSVTTQ